MPQSTRALVLYKIYHGSDFWLALNDQTVMFFYSDQEPEDLNWKDRLNGVLAAVGANAHIADFREIDATDLIDREMARQDIEDAEGETLRALLRGNPQQLYALASQIEQFRDGSYVELLSE